MQLQPPQQHRCDDSHVAPQQSKRRKKEKKKRTYPACFCCAQGLLGVCASRVAYRALIPACALLPKGSAGVQPPFIIHTRWSGDGAQGEPLFPRTASTKKYIYIIFFLFFFREVAEPHYLFLWTPIAGLLTAWLSSTAQHSAALSPFSFNGCWQQRGKIPA